MLLFSLQPWQLVLLFLPVLLNLWGIWHAFSHSFATPVERLIWIAVCIFIPFLGGLAYILFGYRRILRE